ncbi:hypothetical protein BKA62DRAFT_672399 [Auriculariales sp. MPI-PUGE-AT-0066]|nr:hypothetical protein BKA62DRAFT_672399 [Auriculariales sp. MPI-PUGE-AT-0066]
MGRSRGARHRAGASVDEGPVGGCGGAATADAAAPLNARAFPRGIAGGGTAKRGRGFECMCWLSDRKRAGSHSWERGDKKGSGERERGETDVISPAKVFMLLHPIQADASKAVSGPNKATLLSLAVHLFGHWAVEARRQSIKSIAVAPDEISVKTTTSARTPLLDCDLFQCSSFGRGKRSSRMWCIQEVTEALEGYKSAAGRQKSAANSSLAPSFFDSQFLYAHRKHHIAGFLTQGSDRLVTSRELLRFCGATCGLSQDHDRRVTTFVPYCNVPIPTAACKVLSLQRHWLATPIWDYKHEIPMIRLDRPQLKFTKQIASWEPSGGFFGRRGAGNSQGVREKTPSLRPEGRRGQDRRARTDEYRWRHYRSARTPLPEHNLFQYPPLGDLRGCGAFKKSARTESQCYCNVSPKDNWYMSYEPTNVFGRNI